MKYISPKMEDVDKEVSSGAAYLLIQSSP